MSSCQCQGVERLFSDKVARRDLKAYRRTGPDKSTQVLIEALQAALSSAKKNAQKNAQNEASLLDIGGGVGAIQHALLEQGVSRAIGVDASPAYLQVAQEEATRRGLAERVAYQQGDFVAVAESIPPCDIVTLDRVICCYDDMAELVGLSAARASEFYGVVYPRDTWWMKAGRAVLNAGMTLWGNPYRFFVHPSTAVEAIITAEGLRRHFYQRVGVWQVVIYRR